MNYFDHFYLVKIFKRNHLNEVLINYLLNYLHLCYIKVSVELKEYIKFYFDANYNECMANYF